jgi:hypothetical protein
MSPILQDRFPCSAHSVEQPVGGGLTDLETGCFVGLPPGLATLHPGDELHFGCVALGCVHWSLLWEVLAQRIPEEGFLV